MLKICQAINAKLQLNGYFLVSSWVATKTIHRLLNQSKLLPYPGVSLGKKHLYLYPNLQLHSLWRSAFSVQLK